MNNGLLNCQSHTMISDDLLRRGFSVNKDLMSVIVRNIISIVQSFTHES